MGYLKNCNDSETEDLLLIIVMLVHIMQGLIADTVPCRICGTYFDHFFLISSQIPNTFHFL